MPNKRTSPLKIRPLRQPGYSCDLEYELIQTKRLQNFILFMLILAIALYEIMHAYLGVPPQPILATVLTIAMGVHFITQEIKLRKAAVAYKLGSEGEKFVGDILDSLKQSGCYIFHDVVIDNKCFNIDHVILSKRGIYAVETKTFSKPTLKPKPQNEDYELSSDGKSIFIFGQHADSKPIIEAINNAKSLYVYLSEKIEKNIFVKPILVFPGWYVREYIGDNVWVLNPKGIKFNINKEQEKISESDFQIAKHFLSLIARS